MEECNSEGKCHVSLSTTTFKCLESGYFKIKSKCGQDQACSPQLRHCACQVQKKKTLHLGLVDPNAKQSVKHYYSKSH